MGEAEPAVLAEHFERGGERRRAAVWHAKVAQRGLSGHDLQAVLATVERGLSAEPDAETEIVLWGIKTQAAHFADKVEMTLLAAEETMKRAVPGTSWYCRALTCGLLGAAIQNRQDIIALYMGRLLTVEPQPDAIAAIANTLAQAVYVITTAGQRDATLLYLNRLRMLGAQSGGHDPVVAAAIASGESNWAVSIERDWFLALELSIQVERDYLAAGETQYAAIAAMARAILYYNLGAFEEATSQVESILSHAKPGDMAARGAFMVRACTALARGAVDEVLDTVRVAIEHSPATTVTVAYYITAEAHLLRGDLDAAQAAIAAAGGATGMLAIDRWGPLAKAKLSLARGEIQGVADMLSQAIDQDRGLGIFQERFSELLLLRAEAFMASGEEAAARAAIREARDDVLLLAAKIKNPVYRTSFLERLPWNARTLSLTRQWLQDA